MQERLQNILENQQKIYDKIEDIYATKDELDNYVLETDLNSYTPKAETKGIIRAWEPNTFYKEGDYIHYKGSNSDGSYMLLVKCKEDHTSGTGIDPTKWEEKMQRVEAYQTIYDVNKNRIDTTYATKDELKNLPSTDTLNTAIGKLEKALEGKQDSISNFEVKDESVNGALLHGQQVATVITSEDIDGSWSEMYDAVTNLNEFYSDLPIGTIYVE